MDPFEGVILQFPQSFDLKVIMHGDKAPEINAAILRSILHKVEVPHSDWSHRFSSHGKFISFSVKVDLDTRERMDKLYAEMKLEPSIRWAM